MLEIFSKASQKINKAYVVLSIFVIILFVLSHLIKNVRIQSLLQAIAMLGFIISVFVRYSNEKHLKDKH